MEPLIKQQGASPKALLNAWVIRLDKATQLIGFSVTMEADSVSLIGINEEDGILICEEREGQVDVVGFARIFRKRSTLKTVTLYFDGLVSLCPAKPLSELSIPLPVSEEPVSRLDWTIFEGALKTVCGFDFLSLPVVTGDTSQEQDYVRNLLQDAVIDDLLGPADGPMEEIIGMSVKDRYLVGKLAPFLGEITGGIEGGTEGDEESDTPAESDELKPYAGHHQPGEEFASTKGGQDSDDDTENEVDGSANQSLVPSSLGFTFCVDATVKSVELTANWGRYERAESETINERTEKPFRCWKRIPSGGTEVISLTKRNIGPVSVDAACPEVVMQGSASEPLANGDRLVTLFFINIQQVSDQNQDQSWVFQPELIVRDPEGQPIFRRRPVLEEEGFDEEREALEMVYRQQVEFAVGHGVSVHAEPDEQDHERAVEIRTTVLPRYEVPITETPGFSSDDRTAMRRLVDEGVLDMERLAAHDRPDLVAALEILTDDYELWIGDQTARIGGEVADYAFTASNALERCQEMLGRLREGIDVLARNDNALEAFRFANLAMASQRVRSIYSLLKRRGEKPDINELNVPKNRSWRPFQLAFVLLSLPGIADPTHKDRTEPLSAYADLLWFPTGGGKTEAYLGVAAFTMAIRRLQGNLGGYDASRGLSVIMRYTLRLLTLQQFQRATTLLCAMERLRRDDLDKWGVEPFTIGLWVGQRVTPNKTEEAHSAIQAFRDGKRQMNSSPAQLTSCPWCGEEIAEGRDIEVKRFKQDVGRTVVYCGDKLGQCEFSRSKSTDIGLPVVLVDEELYRRPPSMLIATVDKFALMAWRGQARSLFGRVNSECERHGLLWQDAECSGNHNKKGALPKTSVKSIAPIRPPDLIIQDEFHLISGPLGTMVGLYETAVDELSTWHLDDKEIKPKIIAATATVRKAEEQVNNVFLRQVSVFPPHGLDVEDNFFSVQRSIETRPGRRYLGICSPGSSRPAVLIRVYVALLTAAQALFERFGQAADPYMTVVGYFNSLRELGGMKRLAEDDVQTRAYRVQMSDVTRPGLAQRPVRNVDELTSRVTNKDIPKKLDQLEVKFNATYQNGKFETVWQKGETRAIDIVLATNMLSVGVDINRLGLMVMNGQPKSTAEYIQATSRVGRVFPGLVCTVLTWSRPRDLSHFETFEHYHSTFYKHVEAQSVTPFAPRALDRGLTGTMVSLLRLGNDDLNTNTGAESLDSATKPEAAIVKKVMADRAWKVKDKASRLNAETMVADRIDRWSKEAGKAGRRLGYEAVYKQGDVAALLKKPGALAWDEFTVPMSMREVEPGVKLIMDAANLTDPPEWRPRRRQESDEGGEA